jgi:hypothetical protein
MNHNILLLKDKLRAEHRHQVIIHNRLKEDAIVISPVCNPIFDALKETMYIDLNDDLL